MASGELTPGSETVSESGDDGSVAHLAIGYNGISNDAAAPGAVQDILLQARHLLKEQLARHSAEQDRLLDHLLASARPGARRSPRPRSCSSFSSCDVEGLTMEVDSLGATQQTDVLPMHSNITKPNFNGSSSALASEFRGTAEMQGRESDKSLDKAFHVADPRLLPKSRGTLEQLEHSLLKITGGQDGDGGLSSQYLPRCSSLLHQLRTSQEPERTCCLAKLISSHVFGALCMFCIGMNAVFLVYVADYDMAHLDSDESKVLQSIETSFLVFYAIELAMKMGVHRLYFFWCTDTKWNIFDFVLVGLSSFEMALASSAVNYSFMRSFRLFKIAKVLRVFRAIRFCSELRLVFDCILGSIRNLVWCLAMVVFVVYVFALFLVQSLSFELRDHDNAWEQPQVLAIHSSFSSVGQAMLTLIQSTTGGIDWGDVYVLLASANDHTLSLVFVLYIAFFTLAVWNIVTALFVEKAVKLAQPDVDTLAKEKSFQDAADAAELTRMFALFDKGSSGTVSLSELRQIMEHPKFHRCLLAHGIEVTDADLFHRMMLSAADASKKEVDIQFAVAACLRMRGAASSMDLHTLSFESKMTARRLRRYNREHLARLDRIERGLAERLPAWNLGPIRPNENFKASI